MTDYSSIDYLVETRNRTNDELQAAETAVDEAAKKVRTIRRGLTVLEARDSVALEAAEDHFEYTVRNRKNLERRLSLQERIFLTALGRS